MYASPKLIEARTDQVLGTPFMDLLIPQSSAVNMGRFRQIGSHWLLVRNASVLYAQCCIFTHQSSYINRALKWMILNDRWISQGEFDYVLVAWMCTTASARWAGFGIQPPRLPLRSDTWVAELLLRWTNCCRINLECGKVEDLLHHLLPAGMVECLHFAATHNTVPFVTGNFIDQKASMSSPNWYIRSR